VPDRQKYTAWLKSDAKVPFPILSDMDGGYAMSLDLAFWVGDELKQSMISCGWDPAVSQGTENWVLPIPATFIVGTDGIVTALFDNGVTRPVFMIPVATFTNPNGLSSLSGNVWISTDFSGNPTLREAGDANAGQINSASLEASTVDLGEEFTRMITTQRAYSSAAKVITTSDQMLDELLTIKR